MSSLDALSIAAGSLFATQQQLAIMSENIGNAQNQNYNTQTAQTESTGPSGSAVTVSVQRAVNEVLQNEVLGQTSTAGNAAFVNSVYSQLETLTGSNSDSPVLSQAMTQLLNAFQGYQTSPESTTAQNGVVSAAQNLVTQMQNIQNGISTIQTQTQQGVTTDLGTLNSSLTQIQTLNTQIVAGQALGQNTSSLADQRDSLISTVANLIPVRQQQNADGSVYLSTTGGLSLVDSQASQFTYTPPPNYTPTYSATGASTPTPNSLLSAGTISLTSDPNNTALNSAFAGGQIGGELNTLRTDTSAVNSNDPSMAPLAKVQQQLSYLAEQLYDPQAGDVAGTNYGTTFQQAFGGTGSDSADTAGAATNLANSLFTSSAGTTDAATVATLQVNTTLTGNSPAPLSTILNQNNAANVVTFLSTGNVSVTDANNGTTSTVSYAFPGSTGTPAVPGDIPGQATSLADLPQLFAVDQSTRASQADDSSQTAATNLSTTSTSYRGQVGVSVDQQLELMVVLQNSYNAASKVISTISQLEQQLFQAA
jgi:flagellar hook-associated protein 1 FlgK